jgi:threonine synthase
MTSLKCTETGTRYSADQPRWRSASGALLDLEFFGRIDPALVARRKPTMWRYREAIPLESDAPIISFEEGFTPLLRMRLSGREVFMKQDYLFPTGSYKDRGASVLISKVRELGLRAVVQDSSGNAGAAVAAYAARAGIACRILVPDTTSPAKLAQLYYYGASVMRIPGSREDAARAALAEADSTYYASHAWNPFFLHGTKTFAYEVCEQLGWTSPDTVVLPAGNGTLLLGAAIGFEELHAAGIIDAAPRIVAVQSARCDPLYQAYCAGSSGIPTVVKRETLAEGIAIAEPVRGDQMLQKVRETGGRVLIVEDREIVEALRLVARMGFYIEPTAAATIAGLLQYLRDSPAEERIVSVFTGSGLKSTEKLLYLLDH